MYKCTVILNKLHHKKAVGRWSVGVRPTIYQPPTNHLLTTYSTDYLPTIYWPPTDHFFYGAAVQYYTNVHRAYWSDWNDVWQIPSYWCGAKLLCFILLSFYLKYIFHSCLPDGAVSFWLDLPARAGFLSAALDNLLTELLYAMPPMKTTLLDFCNLMMDLYLEIMYKEENANNRHNTQWPFLSVKARWSNLVCATTVRL